MGVSRPSFAELGRVDDQGFQFFVDLCHPSSVEMSQFYVVCVVVGLVLSTVIYVVKRCFRGSSDIQASFSGCFLSVVTMIVVSLMSGSATAWLFPDPRHNGNDCGFTPDSMFLPIEAGFIVPIGFIAGYALLLMIFYRGDRRSRPSKPKS